MGISQEAARNSHTTGSPEQLQTSAFVKPRPPNIGASGSRIISTFSFDCEGIREKIEFKFYRFNSMTASDLAPNVMLDLILRKHSQS